MKSPVKQAQSPVWDFPAFLDYEQLNPSLAVALRQFRKKENVHAYLLTGPKGIGKKTFSLYLAAALLCQSEQKPCGTCVECRKVFDFNNPDIHILEPKSGKNIGVDEVRDLISTLSRHAFSQNTILVLIEPMEKMTPQAQNSLLKFLEEPVGNVVFLLMSHEMKATLGTIASRCVRLKVTPWPDQAMEKVLSLRGYSRDEITSVLPESGGNIGMALSLLNRREQDQGIRDFVHEALNMQSDAQVAAISSKLKDAKKEADDYLHALEQAVYQILLVRTGKLSPDAISQYPENWQYAAQSAPVAEINNLLSTIFFTRHRKERQVIWQYNFDHLLMTLLEEEQKWQKSLA